MSSNQLPVPLGTSAFPIPAIEDGTLARCTMPQPGIAGYTAPLAAAGPARSWHDVAADGLLQVNRGGIWNTVVGGAWAVFGSVMAGPSMESKQFWGALAEEGVASGGVLGATQAWLASLAAGVNDPFGEIRRDAVAFAAMLSSAIQRYQRQHPGQALRWEDPQRRTWDELKEFFERTGAAQFNRAAPSGRFPGGLTATRNLSQWLEAELNRLRGRPIAAEELIVQAIADNCGYLTLAMGSLAEILHDHRDWAARITGLRNDTKDYYRFAGAYVGFQPAESNVFLGYVGSLGNIAGNPVVYGAAGGAQWLYGKVTRDQETAREGWNMAASRLELEPNWNKVQEFNTGFLAAMSVRP